MPVNGQTQRCDRFSFVEVIARRLKTPNGRRHGMVKAAVCNARFGCGGQNCSWSKIYNRGPFPSRAMQRKPSTATPYGMCRGEGRACRHAPDIDCRPSDAIAVAVTATIDREVRSLDARMLSWGLEKIVSTGTQRVGIATQRFMVEVAP